MKWVMAVILLVVAAGCSAPVSGTAVGGTGTETTTKESTTTGTTTTGSSPESSEAAPPPAPPTAIEPSASRQYCPGQITGALGKRMEVVVVATASGRIDCEQAAAVLVDYYEQRQEPDPASTPVEVGGFACNQVPEPDEAQVICANRGSLFYSMWVQGG
jgi:hypothetical protein